MALSPYAIVLSLCCLAAAKTPVGPASVDDDLDCAVRSLAHTFGSYLFPDTVGAVGAPNPASLIFDALRLGPDCNMSNAASAAPPLRAPPPSSPSHATSAPQFYIDAGKGSDSNAGTEAAPFASLARGLEASRGSGGGATLVLRDGAPFYLPATLELGQEDSGLSIVAFEGEAPLLSGGFELSNLAWSFTRNVSSGGMSGPYANVSVVSNAPGLDPGGSIPGEIVYWGSPTTVGPCADACAASPACTSYTWHDASCGTYAFNCFFRIDGQYEPSAGWPGHFTGQKTPVVEAGVWSAPLPAGTPAFTNLFSRESGRRLVRARHPNGNPEEGTGGFAGGATAWLPHAAHPPPQDILISSPSRADDPFFPTWQWGVGGSCGQFEPAEGFWCSSNPPAGNQYNVPSGVQVPQGLFPGEWADAAADGAVFHAFHGERWGDWKFFVEEANATSGVLTWSYGGFQEARGATSGDTFFMEGVLDFLDFPGEWHVSVAAGVLSVVFNNTDAPTAATVLIATRLDSLIQARASSAAPIANLTLSGLTLSHTAPTFMKPYIMPSGGDFSVRRDAAVVLEGTLGAAITACSFVGLGGNAVLLQGWNRGAAIKGSLFRFVGDSAIVSLGTASGMDATAQEFPAGTTVVGNLAAELGLYTKQAGFYYHVLSANATVERNAFFNIPRAGTNINDGMSGGHLFSQNLCFNAVRETSDHGCYNAWDRAPYIWNPADPTNLYPAHTTATRNFLVNNYHSTWAYDLDDGSNSFSFSFSFLPWSGAKNYLGFNKRYISNFYLYPDATKPTTSHGLGTGFSPYCYDGQGTSAFPPAMRDSWVNETCIVSSASSLYNTGCTPSNPLDGNAPLLANNSLYVDSGASYVFHCGGDAWDLPTAQGHGVDVGTSVQQTPPTAQLISMMTAFVQEFLMV